MTAKRFLLIDDDFTVKVLFEAALEEIDQPVEYAFRPSAGEGLQYLENCGQSGPFPDFILVDLKMPVMDGFQFIEQYEKRFFEAQSDTQLFVLTSSISERERAIVLQQRPVKAFITKPIDAGKLKRLMGAPANELRN